MIEKGIEFDNETSAINLMVKERKDRAIAIEKNPHLRILIVQLFVTVSELAKRKGVELSDMEIHDATMEQNGRFMSFRAIPKASALSDISPILGIDGENLRRSNL